MGAINCDFNGASRLLSITSDFGWKNWFFGFWKKVDFLFEMCQKKKITEKSEFKIKFNGQIHCSLISVHHESKFVNK